MPRFFIKQEDLKHPGVIITGDNFAHLSKVLRAGIGDGIVVTDQNAIEYTCVICGIFKEHIEAKIESSSLNENEPRVKVHLFQCLPKNDKIESIIQKCVEIGVHRIYPVSSSRCVTKVSDSGSAKKLLRWRKVSEAAAKQSGRGIVPEITDVISFEKAVALAAPLDASIIFYENEQTVGIKDIDLSGKNSVGIFIGPEGGFSCEEINACKEAGIIPASLGKRILRTETAGLNALSIIMFVVENG